MEKEFINLIKTTLNSEHIGDDCAYLKDLGITVSQDSLVEGVHFLRDKISPYKLGKKTANVNISDICASGAQPKYLTVALSLPRDTDANFIQEFYTGLKEGCKDVKIVGGDLTASDKIYISATAIGTTADRNISSRSNATPGQKIIVSGPHGSSAAGLKLLLDREKTPQNLINAHLEPIAQREFSQKIATTQQAPYAMMDTSDGLMDALSQISTSSRVMMSINFDKIPTDSEIKSFPNWQELVLFGGEDYQLIATVDTPPSEYTIIGEVLPGQGVKIDDKILTEELIQNKSFKHF